MKYLTSFFALLMMVTGVAQNRKQVELNTYALAYSSSAVMATSKPWSGFLTSDRPLFFRAKSPMLTSFPASPTNQSDSYWMSTMTSQSYNSGKVGTFYYWDVQGNLRESRFFFDIAGKNKRGLKLVFRRR